MASEHLLKSGDRINITPSSRVGILYMFATNVDKDTGVETTGMAQLNQYDLEILIADLQRYRHKG